MVQHRQQWKTTECGKRKMLLSQLWKQPESIQMLFTARKCSDRRWESRQKVLPPLRADRDRKTVKEFKNEKDLE